MHSYLALLRGVNVGGKNMIKMTDLCSRLETAGLSEVRSYIQSGNILCSSDETDTSQLATFIRQVILKSFSIDVGVAVFTKSEWAKIIASAPSDWGKDPTWKHNILVMLSPAGTSDVVSSIGQLSPAIETVLPGERVLYQSISIESFSRARSGRLASMPIYKQMTVRNYSTATKLLAEFDHYAG